MVVPLTEHCAPVGRPRPENLLAQGVLIDCVGQGRLDLQYGFDPDRMTQDLRRQRKRQLDDECGRIPRDSCPA